MSIKKTIILFSVMISSFLVLSACSDDSDTTATSVSTAAPVAEPTPTATTDSDTLSMDSIEKAEGVVYQDEIYANWPYNAE